MKNLLIIITLLFAFALPPSPAYAATWLNRNARIVDTSGNVANLELSDNGNYYLPTTQEHAHHRTWNHYFNLETVVQDSLNGAVSVDSKTLILNDATGFDVGDIVDIHSGTTHIHMYRLITVVNSNTLTIDSGVDVALADGSQIDETTFNMAVDGSSTNQIYIMKPRGVEEVDVTRIIIEMVHSATGTDILFGGIAALTNGVHLRKNINNGESYQTIAIWRANKDLKEDMFDVVYGTSAGGSNKSTSGRFTILETGSIINLDAANNEFLELVIQDDLTGLVGFQIKAQGHFEN